MRTPFDGKSVGVQFAEGVAEIDGETQSAALAYFERHDGYAVERLDGDQDPAPAAGAPEEPKVPARGDTKAAWVKYVTSEAAGEKRLADADAQAMTRDQLAEHVLGPKEA